ncbi:hypothetical protein GCM10009785_12070 [Brooklawnia cerclae]|uniref:ESAT-6-like protein n=1 Tax=Brooklawnia cerclae TaxID=349934 RepID=A0ABX0SP80_9ACTN|nr:WXG100 family type VII secretion target [Brooklawnia cerclae]NIH58566.1 WXG100 family type VII secretion target [Brooklawnia cerclae]
MSQDQQQNRYEIGVAIQQLSDADQQIERIQATLRNEMAALQSSWQGNASAAFSKAHSAFDDKFETTQKELQRIQEVLQSSLGDYTRNEADQEQASSAIFNALNF